MSDQTGTRYSLSLLYNIRDASGECDFFEATGLEGVYLANILEHHAAESLIKFVESSSARNKQTIQQQMKQFQKSVISYDRGATWQSLVAPEVDSLGNQLDCAGECALHLYGRTNTKVNPLYSVKEAIGVILGIGNIGFYLGEEGREVNTYFSRDGGQLQLALLSIIYQ